MSGPAPTLVREMHYITILTISEREDLDVAPRWQMPLDPFHPGRERFFAIDEAGVDRELAALEAFVEKEVAKGRSGHALWFGLRRKIEHH